MKRIGLIYCGWGTRDLVGRSLDPWVELRNLNGLASQTDHVTPEIVICAVSVRFAGFEGDDDGTREYLRGARERGDIDHIIDGPDSIPETTARGMALAYLKEQGCDIVIMFDSDEVTDVPSIERALRFIQNNPLVAWYRFSYANLVFDERTRLAESFTPPRAFRVNLGGYEAHSFGADNDIWYGGTITRDIIPPQHFPSMTIPEAVFCPLHYSWLADTPERAARSKTKVRYQESRNWQCSFSWHDTKGLIFNPALPAPKVIRESD